MSILYFLMHTALLGITAIPYINGICHNVYPSESIITRKRTNPLEKQFDIGFSKMVEASLYHGQTFCFQVKGTKSSKDGYWHENNIRYEITYLDYIEDYEASQTYNFSIALVSAKCECLCENKLKFSKVTEEGDDCKPNSICVRRRFQDYSTPGCNQNENGKVARVSCVMSAQSYMDKKYTAVHLKSPNKYVQVQVKIIKLENINSTQGSIENEILKKNIRIQSGVRNQIPNGEVPTDDIEIGCKFSTISQVLNEDRILFTELPSIRDIYIGDSKPDDSFGSIGWMYYDKNDKLALTNKDEMTMKSKIDIKVRNCQKQEYTLQLNTNGNYVNIANQNGTITSIANSNFRRVKDNYVSNVKSIRLVSRNGNNGAYVEIKRNMASYIDISVNLKSFLDLFHHVYESRLSNINVTMVKDWRGNKYMRLTLFEGRGQFLVEIYEENDKMNLLYSFNINTKGDSPRYNVLNYPLSAEIDTAKYVCVTPTNTKADPICRNSEMEIQSLPSKENIILKNINTIKCPSCLEEKPTTVSTSTSLPDSVMDNLKELINPVNWFQGSFWNKLVGFVQLAIYLVMFCIAIGILRKCVIPLISCGSGCGCLFGKEKINATNTVSPSIVMPVPYFPDYRLLNMRM